MFGNNKKEISELQKQVDKAITDILHLQTEQELLKTNQTSLRGLVNRKLEYPKPEEEKEEGNEKFM